MADLRQLEIDMSIQERDIAAIKERQVCFVMPEAYEKDKDFLEGRSPLNKVNYIVKPLLIGQGANDPRVKQAESDQIVEAMRKNGKEVQYVVYPDEGHGFQRPENRLHFFAVTEQFLAKHLGGRAEPLGDLKGHTGVMK